MVWLIIWSIDLKNDALDAELSLVDNKYQQYKAIIQLYKDGSKVL
jgi:hypothetical protein